MKACIFALFAVVLLNAQSQPGRSSIGLPSRTVGHFDQLKDKMPVGVDDGAKGGPAQAFTIEVGGPTDFFANLDSDVAVGRLTLVPSGSSGVSKANGPVATLHKRLQKGSYTLWVGGRPEASGAFVLQVAADQPPTSEMRLFPGIRCR
jgi:hypothetical protein